MCRISLLLLVFLAPYVLRAQCYTVTSTPYDWPAITNPFSTFSTGDDQWSSRVDIGFTFCFYGEQHDSLLIGTNGIVSFNNDSANGYCMWPILSAIPSPIAPTNSIMAPWNDLKFDAPNGRFVYYWLTGNQPNREFHILYDSLPMYSCTTLFCSSHITLYETSNAIAVQIETKNLCPSWNQGRAIVGIQNQFGTSALAAPGRNAPLQWTATQEGWLFAPICNVCQGVGVDENESANEFSVFPNPSNGNFTLQIQNTNSTIASYDVIDISGCVVRSAKLNSQLQVQFTLENPGMYFVNAYDENGNLISTKKLVCN
jgi:hypothetical protein